MKKFTNKQKGAIAAIATVVAGSLTPVAVRQMSSVPDQVDPFFYGPPVSSNAFVVLTNRTYIAGYDILNRNPAWVAYKLHWPNSFVAPKRPSRFRKDKRLQGIPTHDDYTNTGYDRGHLAPSYGVAVCYGKGGQRETFLMSNVAPQTPGMNRGPWRLLEETAIKVWTVTNTVWVVTGPIYGPDPDVLPVGSKVPESFFKVFVRQGSTNIPPEAIGFIVPQRVMMKDPYTNFVTSVDEVERVTGFDFFAALPDDVESIMESRGDLWK